MPTQVNTHSVSKDVNTIENLFWQVHTCNIETILKSIITDDSNLDLVAVDKNLQRWSRYSINEQERNYGHKSQ